MKIKRSPFQPPEEETLREFPTSTFILPTGCVAYPANDIELATSLWRAIEGEMQ